MAAPLKNHESLSKSPQAERWRAAADRLGLILNKGGWKVKSLPRQSAFEADLLVRRGRVSYAVELKAGSEGRSDRLIPLFAQAALQVMRGASRNALPLAVVSAPKVPMRAAEQVIDFAIKYAPDVAVGVFDFEGLAVFRGPGLEDLNAEPSAPSAAPSRSIREPRHLFSDLNQWMLKALLANELPEHLLSAPRGQHRNASQLAGAAQVSVMSAFRFVQQLRDEGYLHESSSSLQLVRREQFFMKWQAASDRSPREVPMRFRLPGNSGAQLRKIVGNGRACLALFAAADALKLGFVEGVPPHVYVARIQPSHLSAWKNLRACEPGESPDVFVRQAPVPESIFRGMVSVDGVAASDVIQVWLDVASHPGRGAEQADLIRRRVLQPIIGEKT
jgi:hypothetical protein